MSATASADALTITCENGACAKPRRHASKFCSEPCRNAAKQREYRRRRRAGVDPELTERARLAREAIREGADPWIALSLVVCPPPTAGEARALLKAAA
jgi:hypothetical protein